MPILPVTQIQIVLSFIFIIYSFIYLSGCFVIVSVALSDFYKNMVAMSEGKEILCLWLFVFSNVLFTAYWEMTLKIGYELEGAMVALLDGKNTIFDGSLPR